MAFNRNFEQQKMKIAFIGDISFNNGYIDLYHKGENPFLNIEPDLSLFDYVVGNLECMAESDIGENELKKPRLKTEVNTLNNLKNLNIQLVSLANNHVYDNLDDGYNKTVDFLDNHNINHIGAGLTYDQAEKPFIIEEGGVKLCIFSYVTEDTNPNLPTNSKIKLNWFKLDKIKLNIAKYKKRGFFVILYNHWGGEYENGYFPDLNLVNISYDLIDHGADLIIGHHSHTLQPYEIYKDKYIFYSLGNFCFSDIQFEGRVKKISNFARYTESVIVALDFKNDKFSCELLPIKNKDLVLFKSSKVLIKLKIRQLIFKLLKKNKTAWKTYDYGLRKIFPYYRMLKNFKEISFIRKYRNR